MHMCACLHGGCVSVCYFSLLEETSHTPDSTRRELRPAKPPGTCDIKYNTSDDINNAFIGHNSYIRLAYSATEVTEYVFS